jgi:hypothetical protein
MSYFKWVCLGSLVLSSACWADGKAICTSGQARTAEKQISSITSWKQLYSAYKAFQHCDDGSIGEGFSESASLLMADKWLSLNRLNSLTQRDEKFLEFVLKHIDETVPEERLLQIENNAKNKCPQTTKSICLATRQAVEKLRPSK